MSTSPRADRPARPACLTLATPARTVSLAHVAEVVTERDCLTQPVDELRTTGLTADVDAPGGAVRGNDREVRSLGLARLHQQGERVWFFVNS